MSRISGIRNFFSSNWFLAAIPALILFLFIPSLGLKYKFSETNAIKFNDQRIYSDLNCDTVSEMIYTGKGTPYYFVAVKDLSDHIFDQWNLPGAFDPFITNLYTGNYDKDSYEEIYIFTHIKDSLFLNVNEILQHSGTKIDRQFITKIGFVNDEVTSMLNPIGFFDENGDGKDEFYFSISTALTTPPRKIYFFDIKNRKLRASEYSTASICLNPEMKDVDGNNRPEIFGLMSASGNYRSNVPYSDSSTWFMVFNDHLKFEFPPPEFPGFANGLLIKSYKYDDFKGYILYHIAGGTDTSVMRTQVMLYTSDGKFVRRRFCSDICDSRDVNMIITNNRTDKIFLLGDKIFELNNNLKVKKSVKLPFTTRYFSYQYDVNNDGEDELLLYFIDEDELVLFNNELQLLSKTKFRTNSYSWRFSRYTSHDSESKIFIGEGKNGYFLEMRKNNYYYLSFLVLPAAYFFFFFFILLIRKINTYQVVQIESLKQRLVTLQLRGIKAQLDPHFTFNTLNSVASLIYLDDRQAAYDYMNKFTRMLRVMLNDAERIYRSLGEEIEFVTTYLDLEKLRFGDKFDYLVEIGDKVSQKEQVPKLVLQTFAENAVKHGLMPCAEGGLLIIRADKEKDYLKLTIEDNGIGRERAKGNSISTGKGLKLTGEFYDILNQINRNPIIHSIEDIYDVHGKAAGTRITVMVPLDIATN